MPACRIFGISVILESQGESAIAWNLCNSGHFSNCASIGFFSVWIPFSVCRIWWHFLLKERRSFLRSRFSHSYRFLSRRSRSFTREPCTADNRMIRKILTLQDAKFVLNKCWPGTGVAAQQSSPRLFASTTSLACCSARSHSATQSRRVTLRGLLWASVVSAEKNL